MLLTVRDCIITASTPHVCRIAILANYMPLSCRFGGQSVPVKAFVTMLVLGLAKPIFHGNQLRLSPQRKLTYQRNFSVPIVQVEKSVLPVSRSLWLEVFLCKNSFHMCYLAHCFSGKIFQSWGFQVLQELCLRAAAVFPWNLGSDLSKTPGFSKLHVSLWW